MCPSLSTIRPAVETKRTCAASVNSSNIQSSQTSALASQFRFQRVMHEGKGEKTGREEKPRAQSGHLS